MAPFEYNPPSGGVITGDLNAVVLDPGGVTPVNIIQIPTGWNLKVDWHIAGGLVGMLAGKWHVAAYLELMGPGSDLALPTPPPFEIQITAGTPTGSPVQRYDYSTTFVFGPTAVTTPGAYKLVVVLTSRTALGAPGPFAAFVEVPSLVQFYP